MAWQITLRSDFVQALLPDSCRPTSNFVGFAHEMTTFGIE
jgi:hypothetical protein